MGYCTALRTEKNFSRLSFKVTITVVHMHTHSHTKSLNTPMIQPSVWFLFSNGNRLGLDDAAAVLLHNNGFKSVSASVIKTQNMMSMVSRIKRSFKIQCNEFSYPQRIQICASAKKKVCNSLLLNNLDVLIWSGFYTSSEWPVKRSSNKQPDFHN